MHQPSEVDGRPKNGMCQLLLAERLSADAQCCIFAVVAVEQQHEAWARKLTMRVQRCVGGGTTREVGALRAGENSGERNQYDTT